MVNGTTQQASFRASLLLCRYLPSRPNGPLEGRISTTEPASTSPPFGRSRRIAPASHLASSRAERSPRPADSGLRACCAARGGTRTLPAAVSAGVAVARNQPLTRAFAWAPLPQRDAWSGLVVESVTNVVTTRRSDNCRTGRCPVGRPRKPEEAGARADLLERKRRKSYPE